MDSQPQNPNPRTTSQNHKQKRNMDKLKKAVLGAMTLDSATPLSEETKKCIEKRLLQLFPVIRTPDHPPYAWMILDAIKTLKEKRGSSEKSLSEFIKSNHEVPWAHSSYLSHHLCKLAQNGDIVVTSDDHYMIPTGNPNPKRKEKQQKRKRHQGRGRRGIYDKEAVVEKKNQLGEQEKVVIKELSQAQKHENYVIDGANEQDYQVNEGKNQSQGQQNEVRSELLQSSCLNDDNCATLMVIPVESSSPRVEDEGESVEELPKQQNRRKSPFDSLPPVNTQHHFEEQQPQSQHQGIASIPEEDTDAGALLPIGPPQHTLSQHRGQGRPPEPQPDTITRDEALLPLQHESYQQHPPQNRGRGRPRKLKRDAEITVRDFSSSQNLRRGRPRKPKQDAETMMGGFSTSQNLRRSKRKPHFDTTMENHCPLITVQQQPKHIHIGEVLQNLD